MGYSNNIPGKFWTYLIPKPGMVVVVVSAVAVVFLCLKHIFNGVFRGWWYPWNQLFNYLSFHIITLWDLYWCHYMHSQDIYSPIIFLLESFQFPAKSGCLIFDLRLPNVGESSNCAAWRKTLATTGRRWWVVLILRYFKVNRRLRFVLKFRFLNDDLRLQQKNERLLWLDKSRLFFFFKG